MDVGDQRLRPDRAFQAECDRQRLLQMRPPGHHRVAVLFRLRDQCGDHAGERGADQRQALAHLEHRGGVHDVLRGGAPVRPAAGLARGARQARDQADHRVADIARTGGKFLGDEVFHARGAGDRLGRIRRDDAEPRLHAGKRRLDVEHALEIRVLVEHRAHRVAAVEGAEDRAVGGVDGHGWLLFDALRYARRQCRNSLLVSSPRMRKQTFRVVVAQFKDGRSDRL